MRTTRFERRALLLLPLFFRLMLLGAITAALAALVLFARGADTYL
jgi:hypothetical protein